MSYSKEVKTAVTKLNNIPEKQRGKKRTPEDCIKFHLNITEFSELDDTVLSKKYPIYFRKTPHIAIPRIKSNIDENIKTGSLLDFGFQDQTAKENENNQISNNTVFAHVSEDTFKESTPSPKTHISTNDKDLNSEVLKSKQTLSEKDISDTDNQTIVSNNIVTELDVTKLKLTFKNLINHRSSATSGDDKSSREQSGSKLPMIRGTSIEDISKNTDSISHAQLEKELNVCSDPGNVHKEKDDVLHKLENTTDITCTVISNSCSQDRDDVNAQPSESENVLFDLSSKIADIEKQTRSDADNNSELPVLADISTSDFSVLNRVDPFPPILTPANATDSFAGPSGEGSIETDQVNPSWQCMQTDRKEQDFNSKHKVNSPKTDESTKLKVYVVEENSLLNTSDERASSRPEQSVEEHGSKTNFDNQTLVENKDQTTDINNLEKELINQYSNICEPLKAFEPLRNNSSALIKRPKPKKLKKPVVKQEPRETGRKPLSQHDGYDSDATMIYDEDERNENRGVLVRGTDVNPLKIKHTQQLLRLKSKIIESSTDANILEKSPDTNECIESLYPSFRAENLDKSEDVSSKVCSSDDPESHLGIKDSTESPPMETTPVEAKLHNPTSDSTKPINKLRICMKTNKSRISKHRHLKREKSKPSEIQLTATKWDQAITGPDNMVLADLTISRGISKNGSKTNSKNRKNRDNNSDKKRRNDNKKRRDSQDMVLKNINKIFPKPRRKRPKDEDDLPTILPPKRRRQGKGDVTPDKKSDMDRINHEFPHFNWLEKKYTDQKNVDRVVHDINNQNSKTGEQNVSAQNQGKSITEDLHVPCQNNETDVTRPNQPENRISDSSDINLEGSPRNIPDAEPSSNDLPTVEPCPYNDNVIHTEEDEHMTEDEPALVIDETVSNVNGIPSHSLIKEVTTTVNSIPSTIAISTLAVDTALINTSETYDRFDARSRSANSSCVLNEKDSSSTETGITDEQLKQNQSGTDLTLRGSVEQSQNDSDGVLSFENVPSGTNSALPSTTSNTHNNNDVYTTSISSPLIPTTLSVSAPVASTVDNTISTPVSIVCVNETDVSISAPIENRLNGAFPSTIDATACVSSAGNTVSRDVLLFPPQEPVTKKLKIDENAVDKANGIPPLIPLPSTSRQGRPLINRAKLFDPEIEGTYNEIKQIKRELEIKNQEVGRMMLSLKEKEDKLRSLLLSSPLGKAKHHTTNTEINPVNSSAVITSVCTKQSPVLTSTCKNTTPVTNVVTHIDLTRTPPPAHVCKKENTKEILRTLAANPVKVPADIKATCPFISRQRPLSPPSRFKKDGYEGPLQVAHAQKPFEIPGTLIPMTAERSKSNGSESRVKVDVHTTRALSAPVQDNHLGSPINLHHTSRPDSIGAINSTINHPKTDQYSVKSSSSVPFSTQNNTPIRYQPILPVSEAISQSTYSQKTAAPLAKHNTETAIQQELNEALKRRQNFEQRQEQQDYQQFKISKPPLMANKSQRQISQNNSVDTIDQINTQFMHGTTSSIPITTYSNRPSVHTLSKIGQPPPYSGELIHALQRTTQHTDMVNGRMNTTSMANVSHTQLPHSVRLIGAATVPMNNNSRINESNRVMSNSLMQQQQIQIPTSQSSIRPQSVPRQQVVSIPSSVSQKGYQKTHKEGVKAYPPQIPLHMHQTLQSNQQMAVPVLPHRMTSPQAINPSQVQAQRMHQLVQGHPGQQMAGRQQEGCNTATLDTKMKGMISGRSIQRQGNILTQQDGNAKAHHIFGSCIMCGKFSLYLCSTCQNIWYCSQQCQLKHWTTHQHECKVSQVK